MQKVSTLKAEMGAMDPIKRFSGSLSKICDRWALTCTCLVERGLTERSGGCALQDALVEERSIPPSVLDSPHRA